MKSEQSDYIKDDSEEINLYEIIAALTKDLKTILLVTTFTSIISLIISLNIPNIYESKALLNPLEPKDSISSSLQNYSNLAGLVGVNIPAQATESNSVKALEKINSLSFFENNIMPNIFLPELMAVDYWNPNTKKLILNEKIYNVSKKIWIRDFSYPQKQVPSPQESFKKFKDENLRIMEDKKTGFITISIQHKSPIVAKKWVELIVDQINFFYRTKDTAEAKRTVEYLNLQLDNSKINEVKQVLAELLQTEIQKLSLIEANESYVFEYIDPPAVMEEKAEPQRMKIFLLGLLLGLLLGSSLIIFKYLRSKRS
tara:strand:- start:1964 stop:2902 length:939 start_codon:yes stop_codon:yes gene_type:complete